MKVEFVKPFVAAAVEVLEAELGEKPSRGELVAESTHYTADDVTCMVGVAGEVSGAVLYGLSEGAARRMAERLLGRGIPVFDKLAEDAVGELGSMITGRASALLEQAGYRSLITPPTLIISRGTVISGAPFHRLVIPLSVSCGILRISISLRETPEQGETVRRLAGLY